MLSTRVSSPRYFQYGLMLMGSWRLSGQPEVQYFWSVEQTALEDCASWYCCSLSGLAGKAAIIVSKNYSISWVNATLLTPGVLVGALESVPTWYKSFPGVWWMLKKLNRFSLRGIARLLVASDLGILYWIEAPEAYGLFQWLSSFLIYFASFSHAHVVVSASFSI